MQEKMNMIHSIMSALTKLSLTIGFIFYVIYHFSIGFFPNIVGSEFLNTLFIIAAIGIFYVGFIIILSMAAGVILYDFKARHKRLRRILSSKITKSDNIIFIFFPASIIVSIGLIGNLVLSDTMFKAFGIWLVIIGFFLSFIWISWKLYAWNKRFASEILLIAFFFSFSVTFIPSLILVSESIVNPLDKWLLSFLCLFTVLYFALINSFISALSKNNDQNNNFFLAVFVIVPLIILMLISNTSLGPKLIALPFTKSKFGHYHAKPYILDSNFTTKIGFNPDIQSDCEVKSSLGTEYYISCDFNKTQNWILPKDKVYMLPSK